MDHMFWEIITFTSHYCKWCVFTYLGGNGVQMAVATNFFLQSKKCLGQKICSPCLFGEGYRCHGPHNLGHCHPHFSLLQVEHIHRFGWEWCANGDGYKFPSPPKTNLWDKHCVYHAISGRGIIAMDHVISLTRRSDVWAFWQVDFALSTSPVLPRRKSLDMVIYMFPFLGKVWK